MKLSIIVPTIDGIIHAQIPEHKEVELVVVKGVSPVGRARNEGISKAHGEYIAWIDSDDEITNDYLDEILNTIDQFHPDVITFDAKLVGWSGRADYVWGVKKRYATIERLKRDVFRDITRPSALWLYVTKRELWEGLQFDESVRTAEDYLIFTQVIVKAKSCTYIPQKLYRYLRNEKSLVNTQKTGQVFIDFEVQRRQIEASPREYRGKMIWGAGLNMFWMWRRLKKGAEAEYAQEFICRYLGTLLKETWGSGDFTLFDKIRCTARFLTGAIWKR